MKKLLGIVLALASVMAQARETINIAWGFNVGSNQANTVRVLIEELNKTQDQYQFVLLSKPGAGGTIAANSVTENPNNTLVSMSSSFIIRPLFERREPTHDLDQYRPILVQGTGSPLVFVSAKYQSMDQVLALKDINVGVSGVGSISHLAANTMSKPGVNVNVVNFKSMLDAGIAAGGNHVDVSVALLPDVQSLVDANKVSILAYTGQNDIAASPARQLSRWGLADTKQLTANYAIFASNKMDPQRFAELSNLFAKANQAQSVKQSMAIDLLTPSTMPVAQAQDWYKSERQFWKKQVDKIAK